MKQMRSIIRIDFPALLGRYIGTIESITHAKVVLVEYNSHEITFELVHHNHPSCPECGEGIHDYGHGLCLKCWLKKRNKISEQW